MKKKKTIKELSKAIQDLLQDSEGKIIISMVHEIYGPLRDLHFVLQNPDPKDLAEYLYDGWEDIGISVHQELMLATKPMVLPYNMLKGMTKTPPQVQSIQKGEEYIKYMLKENSDQDVWYYRLGVL